MGSFSTSLAGLQADSQDLSVISNNLANLNTVAYKGATAAFQDLFYQQIGSSGDGNPIQLGVGTQIGSIPADFTQGTIQSTGVPTDVAIEGNGFFVADDNGSQVYLRAGNFSINSNGTLESSNGATILGLPAVNGAINTNATPGPLTISQGQINPPNATTTAQLSLNLDSGTAAAGTFSTPLTVYDSLGAAHVLTFTFTNTGPGAWNYSITIPAADVGQTGNPVTVKTGTLTFNGSGQLTAPTGNVTGINVAGLADGANTLTFNWDLYDANGNGLLTQEAAASSTSSTQQDGYPSGSLSSYTINSDGTIEGTFSNGQTQALGQILLANFPNEEGLVRNGKNEFLSSLASGAPIIGAPGTGGRGTLSGGSLEQSNVDISTQFAQLILAQSGYEANAKVVTTLDTVTQATINLIQ
ncbi:MAG TPA: flagellar hook protein FlgE [Candidatus Aquilonibacter sp.]|nr:flagellar hook protein FlgE [Candidatus Aquilonibacter sp.]